VWILTRSVSYRLRWVWCVRLSWDLGAAPLCRLFVESVTD
jgi:hypothetical protein